MSEPDVVLAIDLGTGGPKVALVGLDGEVIDHEHRRVPTRLLDEGGAVQDPADWWSAVAGASQVLMGRETVRSNRIIAVACTGQWGSTVPVDESGEPVGDCMLWFDRRGRDLARAAVGGRPEVDGYGLSKAIRWIRRAGGAPSGEGNDPLGHRLWLRHADPEVDRAAACFLEPIDWLNWRLCGRMAATPVSMLLWWLTDNRRLENADYDPKLLALAQVNADRLPPLLPVRSVVGGLLEPVADDLGIAAGIPVVTALPDLHSTALGSGAVRDFEAHLSISTSGWIGCHVPFKKTSLRHQMATVPSALPGRYVLANNHETAGACLEWLRDQVILADDGLTDGDAGLGEFDAVASNSMPGSGGVVFAPWLNGERSPVADTHLRGSFHNLSTTTNRADLIRSVLEGVAHNARWLLDASETVLGQSLGQPRLVGGGAKSDLWAQIHADVLDRPVHRVADPLLAAVRGAGLFAGLVLDRLDVDEAARRVRIERTFTPDPDRVGLYQDVYREFVGLYRTERKLYRRLNG